MQILNAIREHYLMKREADHGSQLFWDRIFLALGLQSFTPERLDDFLGAHERARRGAPPQPPPAVELSPNPLAVSRLPPVACVCLPVV